MKHNIINIINSIMIITVFDLLYNPILYES